MSTNDLLKAEAEAAAVLLASDLRSWDDRTQALWEKWHQLRQRRLRGERGTPVLDRQDPPTEE